MHTFKGRVSATMHVQLTLPRASAAKLYGKSVCIMHARMHTHARNLKLACASATNLYERLDTSVLRLQTHTHRTASPWLLRGQTATKTEAPALVAFNCN